MKDVAELSKAPKVTPSFITSDYKIKEYIARKCCDRIEDLLRSTYEEEAPAVIALQKCSQGTQTERSGSKRRSKENERIGDGPDKYLQEMVEIQRLKSKVSKVNDLAEGPDDLLGIDNNREPDQNDNIPDDLYEIIENFSFDFSEHSEEGASEERAERFVAEFETLRKLQEIVDHIAYCLATFMRDIDIMDRNIFSLHDRIQPPVLPNLNADNLDAAGGDLPLDVRVMALLLSQGDNRHVEELLRTVHQNVIVNVNLSYYFKIMIFLLTFNTLLLFKWMLWDAFPAILD